MIATQGGYTPAGQLIADQTVSSLAPGISQAGKQAAIDYAKGNPDAFTSLKDAFASGPIDGLSNIATGFATPQAFVPITVGAGGTSIMESEEQFEEDLRRMAFEK